MDLTDKAMSRAARRVFESHAKRAAPSFRVIASVSAPSCDRLRARLARELSYTGIGGRARRRRMARTKRICPRPLDWSPECRAPGPVNQGALGGKGTWSAWWLTDV